ncbi:MAG: hypothetical protein WA461_01685, partial [Nitrososphaeraceae archaeon]
MSHLLFDNNINYDKCGFMLSYRKELLFSSQQCKHSTCVVQVEIILRCVCVCAQILMIRKDSVLY